MKNHAVKYFTIFSVASGLIVSPLWADEDEARLDPAPNPRSVHPILKTNAMPRLEMFRFNAPPRASDLKELIGRQTPVKSQGHRGTCSIFSATATLESLLKIREKEDIDLSENYLEYVVMTKVKSSPSEGSDTPWNIPAFRDYGALFEKDWGYEEYDWTETDIPQSEIDRADEVCGKFKGKRKKGCLLGHMDPENDQFTDLATSLREEKNLDKLTYRTMDTDEQIKKRLDANLPVILSLEFFYKAWNHRKMVEYGLGQRDMSAWGKGIVSTPTPQDVRVSRQHPAGHSIVLVGYSDAQKVYYFKNSWGTSAFGVNSDLLGSASTAGYGSITYDYAQDYGTFFAVDIKE